MAPPNNNLAIRLVGDIDHSDFRDAIGLIRTDARVIPAGELSPELIVVAQSRPSVICSDDLNRLRRDAPISGIVSVLGSWCEGETRSGRPWPGAHRLYWYEFPAWWRRQMLLRAAGRCPDWARPANFGLRIADCALPNSEPGRPRLRSSLIVLRTARRDNADALADVFSKAGYSTAWQPLAQQRPLIRGAVAGVWDGGQLNDREAVDLTAFCHQMARDAAPVLALLDFPRRDRVDHALQIGAAAVLGKPWLNSDLIGTLEAITEASSHTRAA